MSEPIETEVVDVQTVNESEGNATPAAALPLATTDGGYLATLEVAAGQADRTIKAYKTLFYAFLKVAEEGDWIIFKTDRGDVARLGFDGCMRVASFMGVKFGKPSMVKEVGEDSEGKWYRYLFTVDAEWGKRTIWAEMSAASRDLFYGFKNGQWKPLTDVSERNVRVAARRAAFKEGVRMLFGLTSVPVATLEAAGVKLVYAGQVNTGEWGKPKSKTPKPRCAADPNAARVGVADLALMSDEKLQVVVVATVDAVKSHTFDSGKIKTLINVHDSTGEAVLVWWHEPTGLAAGAVIRCAVQWRMYRNERQYTVVSDVQRVQEQPNEPDGSNGT